MPNQNQITGIIRIVVPTALAYAAGAGWIHLSIEESTAWTNAVVDAAAGIVSIVMLLWSGHANSNPEMVKSVAAIDEVAKVELKPTKAGAALKEAAGSKPDALVVFAPN
jgi:hypothetical protein